MNEVTHSLDTLAATVIEHHAAAQQHITSAVDEAWQAGQALMEAKAQSQHGEFEAWVSQHCHLSLRTARKYMQLAKRPRGAVLEFPSIRQALEAISTPKRQPTCTREEAEATAARIRENTQALYDDAGAAVMAFGAGDDDVRPLIAHGLGDCLTTESKTFGYLMFVVAGSESQADRRECLVAAAKLYTEYTSTFRIVRRAAEYPAVGLLESLHEFGDMHVTGGLVSKTTVRLLALAADDVESGRADDESLDGLIDAITGSWKWRPDSPLKP